MSREHELEQELSHHKALLGNRRVGLTRGNHCRAQQALSRPMYEWKKGPELYAPKSGVFCANYGPPECLLGIPESREFFAEYLGVDDPAHVAVLGNASYAIMDHICTWSAMSSPHGWPWKGRTFLCEERGYDRHFHIHEKNAMGMQRIPLTSEGPDLEALRKAVERDSTIVGMICVPRFSNPTGVSYSRKTVEAIAHMEPANRSFQWIFDNAYAHHPLVANPAPAVPIWEIFKEARALDRLWLVGSLSKVTFPGEAVAAVATGERNMEWLKSRLTAHTIGYAKLPQLWHYLFLPDLASLTQHMERQRQILAPKFEVVTHSLAALEEAGVVTPSRPEGGYFIGLEVPQGAAKWVVTVCKEYGLDLTAAGAPYTYGKNHLDDYLRLAPSCLEEEDTPHVAAILPAAVEYVNERGHR